MTEWGDPDKVLLVGATTESLSSSSLHNRVKDVLGYDPSDIVGSNMADYIHPADYAKISSAKQLCKLRERERERRGGEGGEGREGGRGNNEYLPKYNVSYPLQCCKLATVSLHHTVSCPALGSGCGHRVTQL